MNGEQQDERETAVSSSRSGDPDEKFDQIAQKFWEWLKRENIPAHGWITALSSIALLCVTLGQLVVACNNSRQTEPLIEYAKKQSEAAQSFSMSAENINNGIQNAVVQLGTQAANTGSLATATGQANEILNERNDVELQNAMPRLVIDQPTGAVARPPSFIIDPRIFFFQDKTIFQFFISNTNPGAAEDIHYAISNPQPVRVDHPKEREIADIGPHFDSRLISYPMQAGIVDSIEGNGKSKAPVVITAKSIEDPSRMVVGDEGEWFYGELYWTSRIGARHDWKLVFCLLVRATDRDGTGAVERCGISSEGIYPNDSKQKQAKK